MSIRLPPPQVVIKQGEQHLSADTESWGQMLYIP
jgi:hypothetical protein